MRKRHFISSIVLLALSMAIITQAIKLPFGSLRTPQAGFLPLILGIFLAIFSLILFGQAIIKKGEEGVSFDIRFGSWKRIGLAVGALLGFTIFFERLGYIVSCFLLVAFLLRAVKPQKWWVVIVVAFLSSLASYALFVVILGTSMPKGIIGF